MPRDVPAPPYLLSLGVSKAHMAIVFAAGPLSGLLVQPVIGAHPSPSHALQNELTPAYIQVFCPTRAGHDGDGGGRTSRLARSSALARCSCSALRAQSRPYLLQWALQPSVSVLSFVLQQQLTRLTAE